MDIAHVLHEVNGYWHYVITPNEGGGSIIFDGSGSYDPCYGQDSRDSQDYSA